MNLSRTRCIARLTVALEVPASYFDSMSLADLRYFAINLCEDARL